MADDESPDPPNKPSGLINSSSAPRPTNSTPLTHSPRTTDPEPDPIPNGDASSQAFAAMMQVRPFMALFCWIAHAQFPAHHKPETRVAKMRSESRRFYWTCVTLDMIVTLLCVTGVLTVAGFVAYKSVIA